MGALEHRVARRDLCGPSNEARERFRESFYGELALVLGTALLILGWFLPVIAGSAYLIWQILMRAMDIFGPLWGPIAAAPYAIAIMLIVDALVGSPLQH